MIKQDNKYLTFKLGEEKYAIPIIKIKEIIGMISITNVPKLPAFIKGVINLRGKIIPVIDLRLKFSMEQKDYDARTSIVVIELVSQSETVISGLIVDTVNDVLDITQENIEPPPEYGTGVDQKFLTGIGKVKDEVIMLIDVDNIFSVTETEKLEVV